MPALCSAEFLYTLQADLDHVFEASRDAAAAQGQDLVVFQELLARAEDHLEALGKSGGAAGSEPCGGGANTGANAAALLTSLREEAAALSEAAGETVALALEAQRFFGDASEAPPEEFFGHITEFVRLLASTSADVHWNPKRWRCFSSDDLEQQGGNPRGAHEDGAAATKGIASSSWEGLADAAVGHDRGADMESASMEFDRDAAVAVAGG